MPIAKFYFYNDLKIGFLIIVRIGLMKSVAAFILHHIF